MTDPQLAVLPNDLIGDAIAVERKTVTHVPVPNETPHHQTSGMYVVHYRTTKTRKTLTPKKNTVTMMTLHRAAHAGVEPEAEAAAERQTQAIDQLGVETNDEVAGDVMNLEDL